MKPIFTLLVMLFVSSVLIAQNYVSTEPQNKNAILEEFTGVSCPNCPAGHTVMAGILASNPGRAFCVAYHPSNSSYTSPYPGEPDFRRTYPNAFYSTPYCGSSRFMPSSFINRREYGGERLQSRTAWENYANGIMTEASPANMGMATSYDMINQMLSITVEIYCTGDITDNISIYVLLSENNLTSTQSGGGTNYTHKHTFREAFVGQWGDPIGELTTQGSLITYEYEWSAAGSGYLMSNCEVLAFIENQATGEVITGVGVHVGEQTYIEPTAGFSVEDNTVGVGTQAIFTDESTGGPTEWLWTFEGGDPATSTWPNPGPVTYATPGEYDVTLEVTNPAGTNTMTMTNFIDVGYMPEAEFTASMEHIMPGETIDFTDNSTNDPTSWYWELYGGSPFTSTEQNPGGITYDKLGDYDVVLIATNEYGSDTLVKEEYIHVGDVGIDEVKTDEFSLYPNPSSGMVHIRSVNEKEVNEILIRNIQGQHVASFAPVSGLVQTIDLSTLDKGLYFIEIKSEGESFIEKVVLK
jgi:PKD repeat protein